jgi:hypothetical protein
MTEIIVKKPQVIQIDQQKENPTSILILKEGTKNYTIL